MAKNIKTKQGFTIIEVVLVLAIAGLIFLMVFIALPALQRSQRDTQRRNDYSMLSTAVTNYISNNNGRLTKLVSTNSSPRELPAKLWINADGTDPNGQPYYLDAYTWDAWNDTPVQPYGSADLGTDVFIITGANCNMQDEEGNSIPSEDPAVRAYAIYGWLEGAGTFCQDVGRSTEKNQDEIREDVKAPTEGNWTESRQKRKDELTGETTTE